MSHAKPHLAVKTCAHCGRPFAWRKRWARCWAEVRYCSRRCRGLRQATRVPWAPTSFAD